MTRTDEHRAALRALPPGAWERCLAQHSGLPGPRANLELVAAVAEEAPAATLRRFAAAGDDRWRVREVVREHLKKSRLSRADPERWARLRAPRPG
jgi:hypothetical protein